MPRGKQPRPTRRSRGQIEQRGPDTWRVRIFMGRDDKGKKKYSSVTVHGSYKDAEKKRTEMLGEQDLGTFVPRSKMTLQEYLEAWLNAKEGEEKTVRDYRTRLRNDVYPYLGGTKLSDLQPMQLQLLFKRLQGTVSEATGRPLSTRTVNYTRMILGQALHHAVLHGLIPFNPMDRIPKSERLKERRKVTTVRAWSKEQTRAFLEWSERDKERHYPFWILLVTTGLRPGEAMALQWSDFTKNERGINFVTVQRFLKTRADGGYDIADYGKTDAAKRTISVPARTVKALWEHRMRQGWISKWVFPTRTDRPISPNNVARKWKHDLRDSSYLKLPRIRLYDLRHTHATHLLQDRQPLKVVAERLGHADPSVTQQTYQHVLPEINENLADEIETSLFG